MKIIQPDSTAVTEIAFDPSADRGDVLVRFKDGNMTYRYGPWTLAGLKRAVTGSGSVGRELAKLRRNEGDAVDEFFGGCAEAMQEWNLFAHKRVSTTLNCGASAVLAF